MNHKREIETSGNVLFLILIAVALFAALSYVVTQSSRSGGGSITNEKAALQASQIISYAAGVSQGILRVTATNRCPANSISFYMPNIPPLSGYNSASDEKCRVFHPNGGAVVYQDVPPGTADVAFAGQAGMGNYEFTGYFCVPGIGTGGADCWQGNETDLLITFFGIDRALCSELNAKLKITAPGTEPPTQGNTSLYPGYKFDGFPTGATQVAAQGPYFDRQFGGCFRKDPEGWYVFYYVLMAH